VHQQFLPFFFIATSEIKARQEEDRVWQSGRRKKQHEQKR